MNHWRADFVNRPLPRPVYLAVRWADLMELWVALSVRKEMARLRFLREIDVDFGRLNDEQERRLQLLGERRALPPLHAPPLPAELLQRGIWV